MPELVWFSERAGCGATIKLDNKEVVSVSIAMTGVLVRKLDSGGFVKSMMSNFFGPKLYNESSVYKNAETAKALKMLFPKAEPNLPPFKNPVLSAFATAIWNCESAAAVCTMLNEAVAKAAELDEDAALEAEVQIALEQVQRRTPVNIRVKTYNVIFADGHRRETRFLPDEISGWVAAQNADFVKDNKPHRVVRVVDENDRIVWGR